MLKAEKVVIRTPFFSFDPHDRLSAFKKSLQSSFFKEALFLASPSLYDEFIKSPESYSEETLLSLYKYFLRMSFRCTPFGMFSGVSIGAVKDRTSLQLPAQKQYTKYTRLDNHFLNTFIQKISKDDKVRNEIRWFTNNTIHSDVTNIRYVEYRLTANQRSHHLSKIENSVYLEGILQKASKGATFNELMETLVSDEVSEEEAKIFFNDVIESKLLLSELEPVVSGEEPYNRLLKILEKYDSGASYVQFLRVLITTINAIDRQGPGADMSLYQKVLSCIHEWDEKYDPKMVFQSDLSKAGESLQVSTEILMEIEQSLKFLAKLNNNFVHPSLKKFKEEFSKRYEEAEVPLLEVLDAESGLGYPVGTNTNSDRSPLLQGLFFSSPSNVSEHQLALWQNKLIQMYHHCLEVGGTEIIISDDTFSIRENSFDETKLPDSLSTIGSIIGSQEDLEAGNFMIDYHGSSGPCAANLLGRFCYANGAVNNLVNDLIEGEEHHQPDKVYAEIVHLAQARIGNVLLRPSFRKYEIPILTFSGVDDEHTISLSDLMISVKDGRILLRSKKLNKEVVPRNTNAHNYSTDTIPYYHFLCDLQHQDSTLRLNWDWGMLREFKFLPRVKYGKTILSKAQWILDESELALTSKSNDSDFRKAIEKYVNDRHLPVSVVLTQSDNQLPLDLQEDMSLKILRQELRRNKRATLQEFLFNESNLIVEGPEGRFTNEFIIPWTKELMTKAMKAEIFRERPSVQQNFVPGSEWYYVKIYCGIKTSDLILIEVIKPLTDELLSKKIISKWFFIRYSDPDHHLRIRFKGTDNFFHILTKDLNERLSGYLKNNLVWKIQTDTYKRELERYGHDNIERSELLFYHDSIATTQVLELLSGDEGDSLRWQFALKGVNDLLNDFGYTLRQKEVFITSLRDGFAGEFNAINTQSRQQLSDHHRKFRREVEFILQTDVSLDHDYCDVWDIFKNRSSNFAPIISQIKLWGDGQSPVAMNNLLGSYAHMFINRFMRSNQRLHEFVIYDFLCKYYKSRLAREKYTMPSMEQLAQEV